MVVFHRDVNVRQKDYQPPQDGDLLVTKIFATIQGEGPYSGYPAIFVRLAGCNLGKKESCPFCDTEFHFNKGVYQAPHQIVNRVNKLAEAHRYEFKLVVLTGGEPMMQNLFPTLCALRDSEWVTQIETNGYFFDEEWQKKSKSFRLFDHYVRIVVSPKVNARGFYPLLKEPLLHASSCLKILLEDVKGSPYYDIPEYAFEYRNRFRRPVFLSPINAYKATPHPNSNVVSVWRMDTPLDFGQCGRNAEYAAKRAMQTGFRLSLQTHLFAAME